MNPKSVPQRNLRKLIQATMLEIANNPDAKEFLSKVHNRNGFTNGLGVRSSGIPSYCGGFFINGMTTYMISPTDKVRIQAKKGVPNPDVNFLYQILNLINVGKSQYFCIVPKHMFPTDEFLEELGFQMYAESRNDSGSDHVKFYMYDKHNQKCVDTIINFLENFPRKRFFPNYFDPNEITEEVKPDKAATKPKKRVVSRKKKPVSIVEDGLEL